jgi:peptide/nickel transport system permease protein
MGDAGRLSTGPEEREPSRSRTGVMAGLKRITRTRGAGFGLVVVLIVIAAALVGPAITPRSPTQQDYGAILKPPASSHLFGTDELGRDILARLTYGVRASLEAGVISVGLALILGVPMGLLAGHFGGWLDEVLMRVADTLWSFPGLVLAIAIESILGPGLANAMVAIGIVYAPVFARLVRSQHSRYANTSTWRRPDPLGPMTLGSW